VHELLWVVNSQLHFHFSTLINTIEADSRISASHNKLSYQSAYFKYSHSTLHKLGNCCLYYTCNVLGYYFRTTSVTFQSCCVRAYKLNTKFVVSSSFWVSDSLICHHWLGTILVLLKIFYFHFFTGQTEICSLVKMRFFYIQIQSIQP